MKVVTKVICTTARQGQIFLDPVALLINYTLPVSVLDCGSLFNFSNVHHILNKNVTSGLH